jgi:uncharacterized membrane protein YciS (DUF1049 family)
MRDSDPVEINIVIFILGLTLGCFLCGLMIYLQEKRVNSEKIQIKYEETFK